MTFQSNQTKSVKPDKVRPDKVESKHLWDTAILSQVPLRLAYAITIHKKSTYSSEED